MFSERETEILITLADDISPYNILDESGIMTKIKVIIMMHYWTKQDCNATKNWIPLSLIMSFSL